MAEVTRRKHRGGEKSRQKILDAATEIAGERGYEGTSIALVSERSGLPASSIYWHFKDKDALIAAVIERSYDRWMADMSAWTPTRTGATRDELLVSMMQQTAKSIVESPDFLRLGLMLTLERRPEEPSARRRFLEVREHTLGRVVSAYAALFPELDRSGTRQLATFTMAMADGLFVALEVNGDSLDLLAQFESLAAAVLAAAEHLRPSRDSPPP